MRGLVSNLYTFLLESSCTPLAVHQAWARDLSLPSDEICWSTVWDNLDGTSKNLSHKLIHFKLIHRMYLTPRGRHLMKLTPSLICDLCPLGHVGSFLHMFWDCPNVKSFWTVVSSMLSVILGVTIPCCPRLLLLNDTSPLNLTSTQTHTLLAGLTAAKKKNRGMSFLLIRPLLWSTLL